MTSYLGFPGGSVVNICMPMQETWVRSPPRVGRSPGEANGNPLQYSCLENPMDGGGYQAIVHGVIKESDAMQPLNNKGGITFKVKD